jgi:hypothetical protein
VSTDLRVRRLRNRSGRLQHGREKTERILAKYSSNLFVAQTVLPQLRSKFRQIARIPKVFGHRVDRVFNVQSERNVLGSRDIDCMNDVGGYL